MPCHGDNIGECNHVLSCVMNDSFFSSLQYSTFHEMTWIYCCINLFSLPCLFFSDNEEHRRLLKELYGDDVNGIEFYVGMMAEERRRKGLFGPSIYSLLAPFSLQAFFAAPICSPQMWRPSTFGGDVGFNIIKTTNLRDLFCRNMPGECGLVSFRVPGNNPESNAPKPELGKTEL